MADHTQIKKHSGSCHCGDVRFEAEMDAGAATQCNCSACTKLGTTNAKVTPAQFKLLSDESAMSAYEWGGKIMKRYFCKRCGAQCFARGHLAQMGGDFVTVNVACLDDIDMAEVKVTYWDGRNNNWQSGQRDTPWPMKLAATA